MANLVAKTQNEGYNGAPTIGVSIATPEYPLSDLMSDSLVAGEALVSGAPCYIKESDKKVYMSQANASGNTEADNIHGYAFRAYAINQPVTLVIGRLTWGDWTAAPVGKSVFLSVTKGRIADARAFTGQLACGHGFNDALSLVLWPQGQPASL